MAANRKAMPMKKGKAMYCWKWFQAFPSINRIKFKKEKGGKEDEHKTV
jgi:hypothetical protein